MGARTMIGCNHEAVRVESSAWAGTDTYLGTEFGGDGTGWTTHKPSPCLKVSGRWRRCGYRVQHRRSDHRGHPTTETFGLFVGSLDFADGNHADAGVLAAASANWIEEVRNTTGSSTTT